MDSNPVRWKNDHNVWVKTGLATQEQLEASVNAFKHQLCKMFPKDKYESCEIVVNLVRDGKGNSYKYAYLWVSDPRVYNIITGFNPDGSERFKEESKESLDDSFDLDNMDMEDAFTFESSKIKKPSIRVALPPILTLPGYEYTEEQRKKAEEDLKAEAVASGNNPDEVVIPKYGYFESSRAWSGTLESSIDPTTLCSYVPLWVTEEMLKKIFQRYSSDKTGIYPKISFQIKSKPAFTGRFTESKFAKIEFSKSYHRDGIFALQMTRRVKIRDLSSGKPIPGEEPKFIDLVFEHYRKNENFDASKHQENKHYNKNFKR